MATMYLNTHSVIYSKNNCVHAAHVIIYQTIMLNKWSHVNKQNKRESTYLTNTLVELKLSADIVQRKSALV